MDRRIDRGRIDLGPPNRIDTIPKINRHYGTNWAWTTWHLRVTANKCRRRHSVTDRLQELISDRKGYDEKSLEVEGPSMLQTT